MSNILVATIAKPAATLTRAQVKQAIAELKSAAVHALSSVSKSAKKESFINTCTAIAVQRAVFGQDEIYRAIMDKARTLPEFKTTKSGAIAGTLGKLLHGYGEAVAVGKLLADKYSQSQDECDMAPFSGDITFSALCRSLDAQAKGDATPPAKGDATPPAKIEPAAPVMLSPVDIPLAVSKLSPDEQLNVLKDLAASLGYTLRKTVKKAA